MTATIALTEARTVVRPAHDVWSVVADYEFDPAWRSGVRTMAPSRPGVVTPGTTTDEEVRFAGRTWHNRGEVTEVVAGRSFAWRTTDGVDARGSRTVDPIDDERCELRLDLAVTPHGIERLFGPLLRRMLSRGLAADIDQLADDLRTHRLDSRVDPDIVTRRTGVPAHP